LIEKLMPVDVDPSVLQGQRSQTKLELAWRWEVAFQGFVTLARPGTWILSGWEHYGTSSFARHSISASFAARIQPELSLICRHQSNLVISYFILLTRNLQKLEGRSPLRPALISSGAL
jgi:hypothetical protein